MSTVQLPPGVYYCAEKNKYWKWYGKGKHRQRRFLCSHFKIPNQCIHADCAQNKRPKCKSKQQCPCGDGRALQYCRNPDCTEEGKGSMYCPDQLPDKFVQRPICPCPLEGCGASLCEHKVRRQACKTCGGFNYEINLTYTFYRNAIYQHSKSKTNKHEYVKLSSHDFREHIKSTLQDGMTWENYGNTEGCWSIGHRIPTKYKNPPEYNYPTEEEMIERLHYTNTFAQWWEENQDQGSQKIAKI